MKVELLKDHEHGKANETVEVSASRGNYLVRCGVAKEVEEKAKAEAAAAEVKEEKSAVKKTKEDKAAKELTTKEVK